MTINRFCAITPLVCSFLALATVAVALTAGQVQPRPDEGTAAHIFQILIAVQAPLVLGFVLTADWSLWRRAVGRLGLQGGALMLAFAPVAYFHL
jgi:hypothetical protein